MNDAELLRKYSADRSDDALRALIERYMSMVYSSCWRQLGDRHLAEDATQAVFVLLSQKAGVMRHSNLAGWLLTTAHYTCARMQKTELRRHRRETTVAMEKSRAAESENAELLTMLDDGLSRLKGSDREAIALRYLQEQPLNQVGQAMGISEEAARKRVDRGVQKLRAYFGRRGVTTAAGALAAVLGQQARAALSPDARAAMTQGILHACHGGAATAPAIVALAKGTNMMMQITRLKIGAAALLVAMTVSTAGWWSVVQVRADGTTAAPTTGPATAPAAQAAATDDQSPDGEYGACRQVLMNVIAAYDRDDATGITSQLYFAPSADPRLVKFIPVLANADLALYRLQKAAVARYGVHALGLRFYRTTEVVVLEDLLSRMERADVRTSDDVVIFNPPAPFLNRQDAWPSAPFYFRKVDGVWKVDVGRTMRLEFHVSRDTPVPGENPDQTFVAAENAAMNSLGTITRDVEQGKVQNIGDLQNRINGAMIGLSMEFSEFNSELSPK